MVKRATGQFWGNVEINGVNLSTMLCIDSDAPDEFMLHILEDGNDRAVLAIASSEGELLRLTPKFLYRHAQDGSWLLPALNEQEVKEMRETSALLAVTAAGYEGRWIGPDDRGGAISFSLNDKDDRVIAEYCETWDDFKSWVTTLRRNNGAAIYRGHGNNQFRLETTLSRAGRNRIERYCAETVPQFRNHTEALLSTRFDKTSADDFSTVLGLAQHHGLPTPLLDWTASPYVAAFFAFTDALDARRDPQEHSHVRIFALTNEFVELTTQPIVTLPRVRPYVASLSISARSNPRLYAQQGQFLVSNVSAMEDFVRHVERAAQKRVLFAADIPTEAACDVLEDLTFMGLTAATMFPGLDGICKMMRHEMSFKRRAQHAAPNVPSPPLSLEEPQQPKAAE